MDVNVPKIGKYAMVAFTGAILVRSIETLHHLFTTDIPFEQMTVHQLAQVSAAGWVVTAIGAFIWFSLKFGYYGFKIFQKLEEMEKEDDSE